MNAHQMITGALNKGENVFACGSVEGINFTVCAVGMDVVVLAADFERVQVIPGSTYGEQLIVSSVSACNDSGKIAATYGNVVSILELVIHHDCHRRDDRMKLRNCRFPRGHRRRRQRAVELHCEGTLCENKIPMFIWKTKDKNASIPSPDFTRIPTAIKKIF